MQLQVMKRAKLQTLVVRLAVVTLSALCLSAQADTTVRTTAYEYDTTGLMTKQVVEPDSANDCLQTAYSYDTSGNRITTSSSTCAGASGYAVASAATARTSTDGYGADGRFRLSSSNALAHTESKTYDARFGTLASLMGPNSLTTTWAYDAFGRKTRETRADGTTTTWAYKLCSDVGANCPGPIGGASVKRVTIEQAYAVNAAVIAPEQRQYLDSLGRVVRSQTQGFDGISAAPVLVQDTEYNTLGQVARSSNQYALGGGTPAWSTSSYDALGRTIRQTRPDPAAVGGTAITTIAYDGLSTLVTNAQGQTKIITRNALGQVVQVRDARGSTVTYTYNGQGNLVATNAAGSLTSMAYDLRGNKVAMLDPAMGAWVYASNAFGERVYQRDSLNQATTMAYDAIGRLTQRAEPDLISDWSYDKKFDASACGKGTGKLCEAKADNGYNRKHSYDSLGRPSSTATVLDAPATPATFSETYDTNTGRLASKSWPTGYQASYAYSALGYLKTVTAGGSNGFAQSVSYDVQAINAQGQISQYRYGNQTTSVKTFEPMTARLSAQSSTKDGQSAGNVLSHAYTYDSLGNLTSRADNTAGVGTQENFSYDSLNRLTMATLLGGAVSPPSSTEVKYDARGNISYKSDVGRYWYDSARPNRMTNVTLESDPTASIPLTGTRALSYVFDDTKAGAQNVNGTTVGNGNLEYTVSLDTPNNRHTLRSESYTSFNMPSQIVFGNFITSTSSTADRTLAFIYGPEHQRIKQTVTLTGNGTSSYFAGATWYLNGEDSLNLGYEKRIRAMLVTLGLALRR